MADNNWTAVRVKVSTRDRVKIEAAIARMTHDEYLNWLMDHRRAIVTKHEVTEEPQPAE